MDNNYYMKSSDALHPIDTVMKSVFLDEFTSLGMDIAETGMNAVPGTIEL